MACELRVENLQLTQPVVELRIFGFGRWILAAIHPPETTRKILDWLRLPSKPPPVAPATLEPEFTFGPEWS